MHVVISEEDARELVLVHYGRTGKLKKLNGEIDINFFVEDVEGKYYILKIANPEQAYQELELQNSLLKHLQNSTSIVCQHVVPSLTNEEVIPMRFDGVLHYVRLLTWIDGRVFAEVKPHTPALLYQIGILCGELSCALKDFHHPAAHRFMKWDPAQAKWVKDHLHQFGEERSELVNYYYNLFEAAQSAIASARRSINHNDVNDYNVLITGIGDQAAVAGVIDYGDAVYTHTINELAIALAYCMMHKANPLEAALPVVRGYHDRFPLEENEMAVLYPLIVGRLLISITCSLINREAHPENPYLQISDSPAWDLLVKLKSISPALGHYAFRSACGLEPCTLNQPFIKWIESGLNKLAFPIDGASLACWLDLSVGSLDAGNMMNMLDPDLLDRKVSLLMKGAGTDVAIGRYDEVRPLYTTDAFVIPGNDSTRWRTVHIGMDFFSLAGTSVFAVLEGTVFSVTNNVGDRDYGPTIILEHCVSEELRFYTLYGHLDSASLLHVTTGQVVHQGDCIGYIGARPENGNWPPHLHFQVILDMLGRTGEFPGVTNADDAGVWKSISPDPWFLLTGSRSKEIPGAMTNDEIVDYRRKHLGKNLSISYSNPIRMVRGYGAYLYDHTGRKYLDTVNNVSHVGHEHPRIVEAGQRQMAVLNTNTRYLHENMIRFVEALLRTMPDPLCVAYVVNSGSEANELALRLAKTFTGGKDMIVSEVGYHGNTNACVELSAYKFDGPGGRGVAPHIHVVPIPDTYRGIYQSDDLNAGNKYAGHVGVAVDQIKRRGQKLAGLIFESVISCGGQVVLPKDFLKESYGYVRSAGGVCIADEVQTGCGRAGNYFWSFEAHGVCPDIVTIGKPIGNGHPLGVVVTTRAIADAFQNGMEYFNTFGGNPVSCAIGLAVLQVIQDEGLQQNAKEVGTYLTLGLAGLMRQFEIIGDVRGQGLFIGFELVKDRITKEPATAAAAYLANRMREKGILMSTDGPHNNVLKVKPPMIFSKVHADLLLDSISVVLTEDGMQV